MFFRFTTSGESHGKALISIIEGMPSGVKIDFDVINHQLWRRQQGYGRGGRMKIETDTAEILAGIRHGKTLGSPIALKIENRDFAHWTEIMSAEEIQTQPKNPRIVTRPRPGHADLAGGQKFQTRDLRDVLERASARETASRVACGAIARQFLENFGIEIRSHVIKLGCLPEKPLEKTWEEIAQISKNSLLNCADTEVEKAMIEQIDRAKTEGDTLGGIFEVVVKNLPVGLGSHTSWQEKLDGRLAQAIMSIQAVKAFEIGEGVANAARLGSEVHDEIEYKQGSFQRSSNRAGGLEGGITNGEDLRIRGYLKPIATLRKTLRSVDIDTKQENPSAFERSDITAVPAAGVIGEAMAAITLANAMREKFGGDSLEEALRNFSGYQEQIKNF